MTLATHEDREVLQGDPDLMLMVAGGMLAEGYDLDGIVAEDLARLRELGIKDITVTPTTIDGEPAQRLEMTVDQGGKTYWLVKTITVHGDAYYQLTWQDLAERRDAGAPVLEEMLASFRTVF